MIVTRAVLGKHLFIFLGEGNPQIHGHFLSEKKGFVNDKLLKRVEHVGPNQVLFSFRFSDVKKPKKRDPRGNLN